MQEPLFGSLQYFFILCVFTLSVGLLYVALGWLISLYDASYFYSSAVGFSGVLFAMAVDEVSLSPFPTRSVFGLFSVPTRLYPWVLMVLLQVVMPNVSFLGHLAGVLVGFVHTWGGFWWAIPSFATLRKLEQMHCLQPLVRAGPYKAVPAQEVLRSDTSLHAQLAQAAACLRHACQPLIECRRRRNSGSGGSRTSGAASAGAAPPPAIVLNGYLVARGATGGDEEEGEGHYAAGGAVPGEAVASSTAAASSSAAGGAPVTSPTPASLAARAMAEKLRTAALARSNRAAAVPAGDGLRSPSSADDAIASGGRSSSAHSSAANVEKQQPGEIISSQTPDADAELETAPLTAKISSRNA